MTENDSDTNRRKVLKTIAVAGIGSAAYPLPASASRPQDDTVEYADLPRAAQELFGDALNTPQSRTAPEFPEELIQHDSVVYEGETYNLNRSRSSRDSYEVNVKPVQMSDVRAEKPDDISMDEFFRKMGRVAYSDLEEPSKTLVDRSLSEGRISRSESLPDSLFVSSYLTYRGSLYRLNTITGDLSEFTINPKPTS
jgi:hypothetical protein